MSTAVADTNLENRLNQVISNIRSLPTPPIVFEQIQRKINDPDVSVNDIASILSEDPAMSVKVLKLTNSAFYGLSREVDSVNHAVMIIGLEAVKNLVLSASVLGMFKSNNKNKDYHEYFWRHSLSTALVAKMIARQFKGGKTLNPDSGFTSGLIHDIGKMVICCFLTDQFSQIKKHIEENPDVSDRKAEIAILGYDHAQLGRQLAKNWKLPDRMVDTIGFHHSADTSNESDNYAHLISAANYVSHRCNISDEDQLARFEVPQASLDFLGIDDAQIESIRAGLMEEYMKAETFMSIAGHQ